MGRTFELDEDEQYSRDGYLMYTCGALTVAPGLTVLVGCNGCGKTSLLDILEKRLKKLSIPVTRHDAMKEKRTQVGNAAWAGKADDLIRVMNAITFSSEGEGVASTLYEKSGALGYFILNEHKDDNEVWVLMDSLDSGVSIDVISEQKSFIKDVMLKERPAGMDLYVVVTANSYELARGEECVYVGDFSHRVFRDYDEYRDLVISSRKEKDAAPRQEERS